MRRGPRRPRSILATSRSSRPKRSCVSRAPRPRSPRRDRAGRGRACAHRAPAEGPRRRGRPVLGEQVGILETRRRRLDSSSRGPARRGRTRCCATRPNAKTGPKSTSRWRTGCRRCASCSGNCSWRRAAATRRWSSSGARSTWCPTGCGPSHGAARRRGGQRGSGRGGRLLPARAGADGPWRWTAAGHRGSAGVSPVEGPGQTTRNPCAVAVRAARRVRMLQSRIRLHRGRGRLSVPS